MIEGGMITTNNPQIAEKARLVRNHGSYQRYEHLMLGYNFRMTDFQAVIGLEQLSRVNDWNEMRRKNASYLNRKFHKNSRLEIPLVRDGAYHVYDQYTVRVKQRKEVINSLREWGIGFGIYYPTPIHQQPLYQEMGYQDILPVAEQASEEVLSLPVHPVLTAEDLDKIAEAVLSVTS